MESVFKKSISLVPLDEVGSGPFNNTYTLILAVELGREIYLSHTLVAIKCPILLEVVVCSATALDKLQCWLERKKLKQVII